MRRRNVSQRLISSQALARNVRRRGDFVELHACSVEDRGRTSTLRRMARPFLVRRSKYLDARWIPSPCSEEVTRTSEREGRPTGEDRGRTVERSRPTREVGPRGERDQGHTVQDGGKGGTG